MRAANAVIPDVMTPRQRGKPPGRGAEPTQGGPRPYGLGDEVRDLLERAGVDRRTRIERDVLLAAEPGEVLVEPRAGCVRDVDPHVLAEVELEGPPLAYDQLLAGSAGDRLGSLFAVAIATGMRQGELFGLRWSDVDLDAGMLAVRHTLRRSTRDLAEPKTERARRTLRLGTGAVATLREHRRRQLEERLAAGSRWHEGDYVFAAANGAPLDSQNVTHALQATLRRLGLPRQRFDDLRHAYATLMLEDGEELAILSRTLGHADLSTTAAVYAHLTPTMLERSAARMDAILGPRKDVASG